ncbi:MAG: histidine phosphatase family protein [Granulosicoccus sp.]
MSLLHLVRHGQASAGSANYDQLSPIGEEQSQILGNWWLSHGFSPNAAYHGTLVRQRDTAIHSLAAITDNEQAPTMGEHSGLNEYNHRVIESHFCSEHADYEPESMGFEDYMGILSRWRDYQPDKSAVDDDSGDHEIERWDDFKARGWNTLKALSHQGSDGGEFVFFTSGGIIATVVSTILDLDFEHTVDAIWRIRNTSITTIHLSGNNARLVEFNTVPHLQEQRKPHLITLI